MNSALVSWWLDYASLSERELWERLEIKESGKKNCSFFRALMRNGSRGFIPVSW